MSDAREADCVIVGGGIGGGVLALLLARQGHRIAILEKERQPPRIARPEVLAGSTVQVFERLGLGPRMREEAMRPLDGLKLWHGQRRPLLQFTREDFARAGVQPHSTDPGRTRQLLLEAASATSAVEVHRGVEVTAFLRERGRLSGVRAVDGERRLEWRTRLIVGDDGGRSRVREAMGIPLRVQPFPLEFLTASGPALPGIAAGTGEAWVEPRRIRSGLCAGLFLPLPNDRTTLVFLLSPRAFRRYQSGGPRAFYAAAARLSPRCEGLMEAHRFPDGFTHVRRPYGHAPRYVADGAALMGDAAHPVTPAGGQGANMSVADAVTLADVAHAALTRGDCSTSGLAPYEAERRPANERSVQISARAGRMLGALTFCPWLASPLLRFLLGRVNEVRGRDRFLRGLAQAFVSRQPAGLVAKHSSHAPGTE